MVGSVSKRRQLLSLQCYRKFLYQHSEFNLSLVVSVEFKDTAAPSPVVQRLSLSVFRVCKIENRWVGNLLPSYSLISSFLIRVPITKSWGNSYAELLKKVWIESTWACVTWFCSSNARNCSHIGLF